MSNNTRTPSKTTIIAGLNSIIADADERAELIARAERRAGKVHGGRFDSEVMDLIAARFGCEVSGVSGGRLAVTVTRYHQGSFGFEKFPGEARAALVACGWDAARFVC